MKKFFLSVAVAVLIVIAIMLMVDVFTSGLRIMLFGAKLVIVPLAAIALVYVTWHIARHKKG